jgi:hypothetical protein
VRINSALCGREGLNYDFSGPSDGFSNSGDGTWTMTSRANQKISSFYVIAIDNPRMAEEYGLTDSRATRRLIGNVLQQAFVAIAIEKDFQFD